MYDNFTELPICRDGVLHFKVRQCKGNEQMLLILKFHKQLNAYVF